MGKVNPLIAIGIPTWGRVSTLWARAYRHLGCPLGSSAAEIEVRDKPIAAARNEIMGTAIASGADYVFMLSDDVIVPGDTIIKLLQRLWDNPEIDMVTGVYWTKGDPTQPYIWRGMQRGPYLDWKAGEFFPVDFAGCDCLLIRLSPEMKALGPEWFNTEWLWEPTQEKPSELATEDFYFYTKARDAGLKLWCDTNAQCLHEDRASGRLFGLTNEMPQCGAEPLDLPDPGVDGKLVQVADIGCGRETPYFGPTEKVKITRFDGDEGVRPDYRCDIRHLPVPDQSYDAVHTRHVLEHFGRAEVRRVLDEWCRILRVGGELYLSVPNFLHAINWIQKMEMGEAALDKYPWWQVYGAQSDHYDFHKNGFTPKRLKLLLENAGYLENVEVVEVNDGVNLRARARKASHPKPYALTPAWDHIVEQEAKSGNGHDEQDLEEIMENQAAPEQVPAREAENVPYI